MNVIETQEQIFDNINLLEHYLCEGNDTEQEFVKQLVKRGRCFLAYEVDEKIRFAPSRFIGYQDNDMISHINNYEKDGKETNPAITKCLKVKLIEDIFLREEHRKYCYNLGIVPDNVPKVTFWKISLNEEDLSPIPKTEKLFPEGSIIERIHLNRERNSKVIDTAKQNFKNKHGKLFCQVCEFDFQQQYGEIGEDFIEGHHTTPVSEMKPNHITKPEEIAMVCSNCHRMLHRKRPWLSIDKLKELIKK
jgi:predicted HNH restriction endonuclease